VGSEQDFNLVSDFRVGKYYFEIAPCKVANLGLAKYIFENQRRQNKKSFNYIITHSNLSIESFIYIVYILYI